MQQQEKKAASRDCLFYFMEGYCYSRAFRVFFSHLSMPNNYLLLDRIMNLKTIRLLSFIVSALAFSFLNSLHADAWQQFSMKDTNTFDVVAKSDGKLFATTQKGIFLSTDNGNSWKKELALSLTEYDFCSITTNSQGSMFALANDKIYERTGTTAEWKALTKQDWMVGIRTVFLSKEDLLFATTNTEVWRSSNHGAEWEQVGSGLPEGYPDIWEIDQTSNGDIFVATSGIVGGHIYRSTDQGSTFSIVFEGNLNTTIFGIFPTSHNLLASTTLAGLIFSTSNGDSWDYTSIDASSQIKLGKVIESNNTLYGYSYGVADGGGFYTSSDYGQTWTKLKDQLPTGAAFHRFSVTSGGKIIAATAKGLFSFDIATANVRSEFSSPIALTYSYTASSITFSIIHSQLVTAEIRDLLGRIVYKRSFWSNSNSSQILPLGSLKSGTYLCSVITQDATKSLKIVIAR